MAHKDLQQWARDMIEHDVGVMILSLGNDQSLALAREAWINAFDRAAEELDAQ